MGLAVGLASTADAATHFLLASGESSGGDNGADGQEGGEADTRGPTWAASRQRQQRRARLVLDRAEPPRRALGATLPAKRPHPVDGARLRSRRI